MIKDTMERNIINEISALFVMIFTAGLMFVMPMLDIECDDIIIIIGFGIILSFILTIIPILLSYDIRDEIIEMYDTRRIYYPSHLHVNMFSRIYQAYKDKTLHLPLL